jgi:RNA polymerase sigma factor (sigma-70 family)
MDRAVRGVNPFGQRRTVGTQKIADALGCASATTEPAMPFEQSITDLLPALIAGDSVAEHRVWDAFFANLCRVAHHRLTAGRIRGADEEDVAISAFASVCRRLQRGDFPELNSRDDMWRLLVTVTERKAYTLLRDERRQKRGGGKLNGESVFQNLESSQGHHGLDAIASAEPSPEFEATMAEVVRNLLGALDEQTRRIALLKVEGHRNEDIAAQLGRSIPTIERKLKLIRSIWSEKADVEDINDS